MERSSYLEKKKKKRKVTNVTHNFEIASARKFLLKLRYRGIWVNLTENILYYWDIWKWCLKLIIIGIRVFFLIFIKLIVARRAVYNKVEKKWKNVNIQLVWNDDNLLFINGIFPSAQGLPHTNRSIWWRIFSSHNTLQTVSGLVSFSIHLLYHLLVSYFKPLLIVTPR